MRWPACAARANRLTIWRSRPTPRAALQNASNRYRAGYSGYIEQLDAQRNLLTAELSLVQARADRLSAYAALYQAMGGGWSREAVAATSR